MEWGGRSARIFAAEVRGKRPPTEVREDELTSRVLGVLSHVSPSGRKDVLANLGLGSYTEGSADHDVTFWPRLRDDADEREPDAVIAGEESRLVFEFKWGSEGYAEHLVAEWRLTDPRADILVYVTPSRVRPIEVDLAEKQLGLPTGTIRWISWSKVLRAIRDAGKSVGDLRDQRLLDDIAGLLEVLGVTEWEQHLDGYWRTVDNKNVAKAFEGLSQYFKNVRSYLATKYEDEDYRVGQAQTSFAGQSYVEFTSGKVVELDPSLGTFVHLNHRDRDWSLTLDTLVSLENGDRAYQALKRANSKNIEPADPRKNDYMIGSRPFKPKHGFDEPESLREEIEIALKTFADDAAAALVAGKLRK